MLRGCRRSVSQERYQSAENCRLVYIISPTLRNPHVQSCHALVGRGPSVPKRGSAEGKATFGDAGPAPTSMS